MVRRGTNTSPSRADHPSYHLHHSHRIATPSSTGFGASCNFCDSDDQDDYQNYTTVHDDGDDDYCSGCNIMSGSSGTWGIGIAMTLPVVRFAVMLMRERVNKAKHVMIAQGLRSVGKYIKCYVILLLQLSTTFNDFQRLLFTSWVS